MLILTLFAFIAGFVTILSPCILPILPIVLSGSVGGHKRPFGIVLGFIFSFTFFTLFLATIVRSLNVSPDFLRLFSVIIIALFGAALVLPLAQKISELLFSKLASRMPSSNSRSGFFSGILIGLSLGLIWTPCVGPIIASVITLAATASVNSQAVVITLAYSIGTAIPMFFIMHTGRSVFAKVPWLLRNTGRIQKIFGILMILTALAIYLNFDRKFQTFILDTFPQYGVGLTSIEDNDAVKKQLEEISNDKGLDANSNLPTAPDLIVGGEWVNSKALKISDLRGKVVLVDFWTYTCINCIRTLPYLKSWHEKYKDDGLVIIGVHTPEFEFEKSISNLKNAISDYEIEYPVMQDNDYATWRAFSNRYWPAKYLINKDGKIVYTHFGEGEYDKTEEMIQSLLNEAGSVVDKEIDNPDYTVETQTPELYLGLLRLKYFSSNELPAEGVRTYTVDEVSPNTFAFSGKWILTDEYANPLSGSRLILNYYSKDVFLVMRTMDGKIGKVSVVLDGKENGEVEVTTDRLYDIVKLNRADNHELELIFETGNIEVFAFTFG